MASRACTERAVAIAKDVLQAQQNDDTSMFKPNTQGYWDGCADSEEMTAILVPRLFPCVSNYWVQKALLALSASASVTLLVKLLRQADSQLREMQHQESDDDIQHVQATAAVLSTAYENVLLKFDKTRVAQGNSLDQPGSDGYHIAVTATTELSSDAHAVLCKHINTLAVSQLYTQLLNAELRCKTVAGYTYPCLRQLLSSSSALQRLLSTKSPTGKATATQGSWLDTIMGFLRVSNSLYSRMSPDDATHFSSILDHFLSGRAALSASGARTSLLVILYESAVSSTPVEYGPLAAKAMLCVCQIIILTATRPLPSTTEQLFSRQQLSLVEDVCGQLQYSQSVGRVLRVSRTLLSKQKQLILQRPQLQPSLAFLTQVITQLPPDRAIYAKDAEEVRKGRISSLAEAKIESDRPAGQSGDLPSRSFVVKHAFSVVLPRRRNDMQQVRHYAPGGIWTGDWQIDVVDDLQPARAQLPAAPASQPMQPPPLQRPEPPPGQPPQQPCKGFWARAASQLREVFRGPASGPRQPSLTPSADQFKHPVSERSQSQPSHTSPAAGSATARRSYAAAAAAGSATATVTKSPAKDRPSSAANTSTAGQCPQQRQHLTSARSASDSSTATGTEACNILGTGQSPPNIPSQPSKSSRDLQKQQHTPHGTAANCRSRQFQTDAARSRGLPAGANKLSTPQSAGMGVPTAPIVKPVQTDETRQSAVAEPRSHPVLQDTHLAYHRRASTTGGVNSVETNSPSAASCEAPASARQQASGSPVPQPKQPGLPSAAIHRPVDSREPPLTPCKQPVVVQHQQHHVHQHDEHQRQQQQWQQQQWHQRQQHDHDQRQQTDFKVPHTSLSLLQQSTAQLCDAIKDGDDTQPSPMQIDDPTYHEPASQLHRPGSHHTDIEDICRRLSHLEQMMKACGPGAPHYTEMQFLYQTLRQLMAQTRHNATAHSRFTPEHMRVSTPTHGDDDTMMDHVEF